MPRTDASRPKFHKPGEASTSSGLIIPGSPDTAKVIKGYRISTGDLTLAGHETVPGIPGLTFGHSLENLLREDGHISSPAPHQSGSPYHKVRGRGEVVYPTDRDIVDELSGTAPIEKRARLVNFVVGTVKNGIILSEKARGATDTTELRPILVGVRKAIAKKRLGRAENKLKKAAEDSLVVNNIVEKTRNRGSYELSQDPLRPTTRRQRRIAASIERDKMGSIHHGIAHANLRDSLGSDVHKSDFLNRTIGRKALSRREKGLYARQHKLAHESNMNVRAINIRGSRYVPKEAARLRSRALKHRKLEKHIKSLESI